VVDTGLEAEALAKQDKEGVARTVEALVLFETRRLVEDVEVLVIVVYGKYRDDGWQMGGRMVELQTQTRRFLISGRKSILTTFRTRKVIVDVLVTPNDLPAYNKYKPAPLI
jgi:hypothetical protein